MPWSESTLGALRNWVRVETWDSWHWADESRFYDFLLAVWMDEHGVWNEANARETMVREVKSFHPNQNDKHIRENIEKAKSYGTSILDFLTHLKEEGKLSQVSM